jgi:sulfide:quinone oxidoreductase
LSTGPSRIVVLGAGLAGLETAFLLHAHLHERADLLLVSERDDFLLRPNFVYVPFGAHPDASRVSLEQALWRDEIALEEGRVDGVDTDAGRVQLVDGSQLPYEHLVIATGASARPEQIPGLSEHAVSAWDLAGMLALQQRFEHLRGQGRAGAGARVLFALPPATQCSLPLYEVALMLDTWLRRAHAREPVSIGFVTHEASFGETCGPRMHEVLADEFSRRQIEAHTAELLVEVRAHEATFGEARTEQFDLLVTIPPLVAAARYDGLPADEQGFLRVDEGSRQVRGHPELYATGDAGDFPLKDPYLALLEADAAADHLATAITGRDFKRPFDAVSVNVIEMLDRAAFAELPLELTGDPAHPVRLRSNGESDYKVGVSPMWRMGKRMFASYLLMRFAAGEPFHAGPGWRLLDVGVDAMAGMLAD